MAQIYGNRILCNVLHVEATSEPDKLFALIAQGHDPSDGFQSVRYQQVARATNWMSGWLQDRFDQGNKPDQHPTLCYIGVPDIRYNIVIYAAIQCGYKIFLPSPRNVPDVNITMLQQLNCTRLLYTQEVDAAVAMLKTGAKDVQFEQMLTVKDLLQAPDTSYTYHLDYDQNWKDPTIILHSSGSTGLPKTVTWTHGTMATTDVRGFPGARDRANVDLSSMMTGLPKGATSFEVLPPFHAAGVFLKCVAPIWFSRPFILAPASRPPTGALMAQILRELEPAAIVAPPSIVEQLIQEKDSEKLFQKLELVVYGGGPLSDEAVSTIAASTNLINLYATTESLQARQLAPDPAQPPSYIEFNPNEGYTFEQYDGDLHELIMPVSADRKMTSALYHNFPHLSQFRTKDVWKRHPTNPSLWKMFGRIDDILVFSSGQKLFTLPMELALTAMPKINGALVVGHAQRQSGLLIEPAPDANFADDIVTHLWPSIEAANALFPAHGRVSKNMVMIAKPDKPFKRTAKGTVIRRSTENLYEQEILFLYTDRPQPEKRPTSLFRPSYHRYEDVRLTLLSIFKHVLTGVEIGDDQNLYNLGLDSIKTLEVVNQIKANLQYARPDSNMEWFTINTMYTCYTLSRLTSIVLAFLNDGGLPGARDRIADMSLKIKKYTDGLPKNVSPSEPLPQTGLSVAVTGTTGFLGYYLVEGLAKIPQISRIYCLNRSPTARQQYHQKNPLPTTKEIIFMTCKFSESKLGLPDAEYSQLTENCSLILHNAWTVHFGLPLDAFDDNIAGVRHLIDLSISACFHPRIHFISTYATTGLKGSASGEPWTVPEASIDDLSSVPEVGYTEAKRVSERILESAATWSGISVTVIRLGQVVPEDGHALPVADNLTFFLKTCRSLGSMPLNLLGDVAWVPVDVAAQVLSEVVENDLSHETQPGFRYFNLVNPNSRDWSKFAPVLDSWCGKPLKQVDAAEWVEALASAHGDEDGASKSQQLLSPELLRVWQTFLRLQGPSHLFECTRLKAISRTMNDLGAISPESLASWLPHIDL